MYQKRIISSDDGSHTIELIDQNEQYHSTHGAIQESEHVYIQHGLKRISAQNKTINILEVGMGTGLNVLLSYRYAISHGLSINYTAVEAYPLEEIIWKQLNYSQLIEDGNSLLTTYNQIHESEWHKEIPLGDHFTFYKIDQKIQDISLKEDYYDVVYHDAFNPDLEPDLWREALFGKIYKSMKSNSLLTTYSTKGIIKRALKSCGFIIQKKPGPPGKREILNAVKKT